MWFLRGWEIFSTVSRNFLLPSLFSLCVWYWFYRINGLHLIVPFQSIKVRDLWEANNQATQNDKTDTKPKHMESRVIMFGFSLARGNTRGHFLLSFFFFLVSKGGREAFPVALLWSSPPPVVSSLPPWALEAPLPQRKFHSCSCAEVTYAVSGGANRGVSMLA